MEQDLAFRLKSKVEELIARCETLAGENADLKARLLQSETQLNKKEKKIEDLEKKIDNLQLKEVFLGTTGDRARARKKVADLIKEIDECVSLLGE